MSAEERLANVRQELDLLHEQRFAMQKSPDTPEEELLKIKKQIDGARDRFTAALRDVPVPVPKLDTESHPNTEYASITCI